MATGSLSRRFASDLRDAAECVPAAEVTERRRAPAASAALDHRAAVAADHQVSVVALAPDEEGLDLLCSTWQGTPFRQDLKATRREKSASPPRCYSAGVDGFCVERF